MGFNFAGGMAAATGYQEGVDAATARTNAANSEAFLQTQRARVLGQQQREQARIDADAAIPTTRTVTQPGVAPSDAQAQAAGNSQFSDLGYGDQADGAAPTQPVDPSTYTSAQPTTSTQLVPREEQIRAMADNARKAGAIDDWTKMSQAADDLEAKRSAASFSDLLGSANGMSTVDLANSAAKIWHSTSLPLQISNVRPNGTDGATVDVFNKLTGATTTRNYDNKDQFVSGLQALADPKTFAAMQADKYKAQQKVVEEQGKPVIIPAGGAAMVNGKIVGTNNNGYIQDGTNADGSPRLVKTSERLGPDGQALGGAAGARAKLIDEAGKLIDNSLKGQDPGAAPLAHQYKEAIVAANPSLQPGQVASIAVDAVTHPENVKPYFDPRTGAMVNAYVNPAVVGQKVSLGTAPANFKDAEKKWGDDGADAMKAQAKQMFDAQPAALQTAIAAGAKDEAALQQNLAKIQASGAPGAAQAAQAYQRKVQAYKQYVVNGGGLFDRLSKVVSSPAPAAAPAAAPSNVIKVAGGIPRNAPQAQAAQATNDPGVALDNARQAYTAAAAKLNSYGARQQAADPGGFAQAKAAAQVAKQAQDLAETAWSSSVGANSVQPAFPAARM